MLNFINADKQTLAAINEVMPELHNKDILYGTYRLQPVKTGLRVTKNGGEGVIEYCDTRALMRAISIISQNCSKDSFEVYQTPAYETLGAMPDASRNAVPTVDTIKKLCRIIALEGYNALMLYTEDTYQVDEYPYFGHLRGRYTATQLREMDEYAQLLGIELIPAIQTLAHLNGFFEWPDSYHLNDCNDILLADDNEVYRFIDTLLSTMSKNIKSRKINIGLDEAKMLGAGRYLDKNGYTPKPQIMKNHMEQVVSLCKKYGYEPRMWSDMFFRMLNGGVYRVKGTNVPADIAASVPKELTLVYWDYIQPDTQSYDEMFRQHKVFNNKIAFAGGDASWYGTVPLTRLGEKCAMSATQSIAKNNITEVYVTMWKDDGASCSLFSSLNSLIIYGEGCWNSKNISRQEINSRIKICTGIDGEFISSIEEIHNLPGNVDFAKKPLNPSKYILYSNILTGKFDCHIPEGSSQHFKSEAERFEAALPFTGAFSYVFQTLSKLCYALEIKSELGKTIYSAYHCCDKDTIGKICEITIPLTIDRIRAFKDALYTQWNTENKPYGFDVLDLRIGGLIAQLETAKYTLGRWAKGEITHIDELEQPRLPYLPIPDNKNTIIQLNRWERMAGQNISNMFGYM